MTTVERLGSDPAEIAARLIAGIPDAQRRAWRKGTAADWAIGSFTLARDRAYGMLPAAGSDGDYALQRAYIDSATGDVAVQLSKAGTKLAFLLNRMLATARGVRH